MFRKEIPKYQLMLENELEQALRNLSTHVTGSDEYVKTLSYVERLHSMMKEEKSTVSPETLVTVAANLIGILMILKYEHLNPITSKALSFVIRPRT